MNIGKRIDDRGRSASLLGAWAMVASALSIARNAGDADNGEGAAISRIVLGLIGLAAAALFCSGRNYGQHGLYGILARGALQIPFYALAPDGNITKQLFDAFLGATGQTTVNGEITSYSQVGINLVGVGIAIWATTCRGRLDLWRRPDIDNGETQTDHTARRSKEGAGRV
ncbi:MAG: hypothetical protein M3Q50_10940 [Chloroflexota bacterium]|nr:hypothetical protein [Chloroflexota bacterium]